jgi:hypothetical protein
MTHAWATRPPSLEIFALLLHLVFFAADVGHDVAEDVERRHARVTGAGDRLHGRDDHLRQPELAQRRQRRGEHDRGAVGIGHDEAGPALHTLLLGDDGEVVRVDLGDEERHERIHTEVAGVADHDVSGGREGASTSTPPTRRGPKTIFGRGRPQPSTMRAAASAHDAASAAASRYAALRAFAGRQPDRLEPRMPRETRDEVLTDDARGAEDADFDGPLLHDPLPALPVMPEHLP